jgi:hypothetical protein
LVNENINSFYNSFREQHTINEFTEQNKSSQKAENPKQDSCFISKQDISNILNSLNNKKSAGPDQIPNIVLEHFQPIALNYLTTVINNAINNGYFPKSRTIAIRKPEIELRPLPTH